MKKPTRRTFGRWIGAFAVTAAGKSLFPKPALGGGAKPRAVVIGGGAAGATAARRLAEDFKDIDVTLVEANRSYTSCFFFNRYVGGLRTLDSVTHDYRKLSSAFGIYTIHAEAVGAALTGGAPKPGKLENICYFLAARDHGLMTGGTYRTKDGKIAGVTGSISQVGEDDPTRKTTADQGDAWYDTVIREMFG